MSQHNIAQQYLLLNMGNFGIIVACGQTKSWDVKFFWKLAPWLYIYQSWYSMNYNLFKLFIMVLLWNNSIKKEIKTEI